MSSDDDDLREDLLQVAGGRSTGKKRGRNQESGSEEPSLSEEMLQDSEEEDVGTRRSRKPTRKRHTAAQQLSDDDESDDNEGETDELDAFDDGYGSDLMGDEEDRARLSAMTELDREMELTERAERREDAQERAKLLRQQKQEQQASAKKPARSSRASTRAKKPSMTDAKKSAMQELKAARERKAQPRGTARDADWEGESPDVSGDEAEPSQRRRQPPSASASEEDVEVGRSPVPESDEEVEDEDERREREEDESQEEAAYEDIGAIAVRRYKLEQWINKPFLERTLPGCLVRLSLGERTTSSGATQRVYMLAQVDSIEEQPLGRVRDATGRNWENPYLFGPKQARTAKWLQVRRGASCRLMPFALVSNSGPSEEEWTSFQQEMSKSGRSQLTNADVADAKKRLIAAETYKFTSEDVTRMVEEKRNRGGFKNTAAERARLQRDFLHAQEQGDFDEAARVQQILEMLEARAKADAERSKGISMAEVNRKNKGVNFLNAFKDVTSRPEGSIMDAAGNDPFSRRKTVSRNYWATGSRSAGADGAAADAAAVNDAADGAAAGEEPDVPAAHVHQDEATGLVDIDIDLSVLSLPRPPLLTKQLLGPDWRASLSKFAIPEDLARRKTLTLADYKQRMMM